MVTFFVWLGISACSGLTPGEVFEDGRRAFLSGHWLESKDFFSRFNEMWPVHSLAARSLYYGTLADLRGEKEKDQLFEQQRIGSLSAIIKALSDKLPGENLTELKTGLEFLQIRNGQPPASPTQFLQLKPEELAHAINRGVFPPQKQSPFATLEAIRRWSEKHPTVQGPFKGRLELLKAKALWKIRLSPLPTAVFMNTLKSWGEWPVHKAIRRSLTDAFTLGEIDVKREAALLGVCSGNLESQQKKNQMESVWYTYLREKGINLSEAWCPE